MKKILLIGTLVISTISCNDFLDIPPQANLDEAQVFTSANVDGLVIAAYAMLANDHYTVPNQLWTLGDLRSGDAHKGGDGPADLAAYHAMEIFSTIQPDMSNYAPAALGDLNNKKWERLYIAISRVNLALTGLQGLSSDEYRLKDERIAEMHFLRGLYYFDLKKIYKHVPWIHENYAPDEIIDVSNREYTSDQLWDLIANEFELAAGSLPESSSEVGRPNRFTAKALLAKTRLYQAYEQDDNHEVININSTHLEEVVDLVDEVIGSGLFSLEPDFANPFLYEYENGPESVWAIQRSINDGTGGGLIGNLDFSAMLNNPMSPEFGCCGFHIPSQNLVNAFKTGTNGLPQFDTFNNSDLNLATDAVDPRLDHTVAQDNKPWKYENNYIYDVTTWSRQALIYGGYMSMKENVSPDCECFKIIAPFMSSSKNTILVRFADVLLWKAEALIELNRASEALPIINEIRLRAKNSTSRLVDESSNPLSNYGIEEYDGSGWTQDFARQALRWERRLELAMEGERFFDLVRWGIAKETLDTYFTTEVTKRDYLTDADFVEGKNEYMPIPQQQIIISNDLYKQNNKY